MMKILMALASGLLFGLGLIISGMSSPGKVLGFLDVTGLWDPSLAFVMGGALLVTVPLFPLLLKRGAPLCDTQLHVPTSTRIDRRLVGGSVVFGIGWGLAGYCPGPALVSITQSGSALLFCGAMVVGMLVFEWLER